MLEKYYRRMSHLRLALPLLKDISALEYIMYNFNRRYAIDTLSRISLKYENELQKIGFYYSGITIVKGNQNAIYYYKTDEDLVADAEYFIDCLIIIGAVRYGMENSIETVLEKLEAENVYA